MRFLVFLLVIITPFIFSTCKSLDREEPIPAYIYIPSVTLQTDSNTEGTASHKIQDVWITVGNTYLGAYELPAMIPTLEKGNQRVLIRAGILENGIAATRTPYPFYKTLETNIELKEKEIDTVRPAFTYDAANSHFDWMENFESGSVFLDPTTRNTAKYHNTTSPDSVFEGAGSFHAQLADTSDFLEMTTSSTFVLPRGKAVWLELNYKTESPVEFGFISFNGTNATQHFVGGVNPNDEWNKIYFNFTNQVSQEASANTFRLYILSRKPNDKTPANILLDNIKLLHLE
jgi:hypothetical protein